MKKNSLRMMINVSLVAAIYVALTLALAPLSYGAIQFRISEALIILVCYNPLYAISLSVGCLLANLASPMASIDVIFGTLATVISVIPMIFLRKNKLLASLIPSVVNGIVIGLELKFAFDLPFFLSAIEVFVGEFLVVSVIGIPLFKSIEKNKYIVEGLQMSNINKETWVDKYLTPEFLLTFGLMVISIVMYFKLSLYTLADDENTYSLFAYTFGLYGLKANYLLLGTLICPVLICAISFVKKPLVKLIIRSVLLLFMMAMAIIAIINANQQVSFYFYFYFVFLLLVTLVIVLYYFSDIKNKNNEMLLVENEELANE